MKKATVIFLICILFENSTFAADITVAITGVKIDQGKIFLGMFNNPMEFPGGNQKAGQFADSENSTIRMIFTNLNAGKHAFAAFQDKNGNKKLDTNFIGIPKERYGFSGKQVFGSPKFEESAILVDSKNQVIRIELK